MQKPIMIVNEYLSEAAEIKGTAIGGPEAGLLFGLLEQAGIDKKDCHITNVFNLRPAGNRVDYFYAKKSEAIPNYRAVTNGKYVHYKFAPELERLEAEIAQVRPNVTVALGNLALWALAKKSGIRRYRGAPLLSHNGQHKIIPTWPMSSIQRQWELRVIALSDLLKARENSTFPELRRSHRYIYLEPTLSDIEELWKEHFESAPFVSCDIETKSKTITEVGYATPDGKHALVIPFYSRLAEDGNYWPTFAEEKQAWKWVRRFNLEKPMIGQNFAYDMTYFWRTVGIPSPKFIGDTMLLHHALQPELEKGLGFLGSLYTNEPSWKFMRQDHDTLKKGDE